MTAGAPQRTRRIARRLAWGVLSALGLVILLYAAFPWWAAKTAPFVAQRFGVEQLELVVGRPGRHGLSVASLAMATDAVQVQATDVRVHYSPSSLFRLRLESLDARRVELTLRTPDDATNAGSPAAPAIPVLPFDDIAVRTLVLRFPATGFVGTGSATLNETGLLFDMDGQQPEAAAKLRVDASLSRAGLFDVRVHERDQSASQFLQLAGTVADDTVSVDGNVDLAGFPLELASSLIGAPAGSGRVMAQFATVLPWPLPETLYWQSLHGQLGTLCIDWTDEQQRLALNITRGHALLDHGQVTASLSGGVRHRSDGDEITVTLPDDYALTFADQVLRGGEGPSVVLATNKHEARAALRQFSLRVEPETVIDVEVDLDADAGDNSASARLVGHATWTAPDAAQAREFTATVRWADRSDDHALKLGGTVTADTLSVNGRFLLAGPSLDFVATLAGAPAGSGRVTGNVAGEMFLSDPPGVTTVRLSALQADWVSADKTTSVNNVRAAAELRESQVDARVSGLLVHALGRRTLRLRVPADYALSFDGKTLRGGGGARLSSVVDDESVEANIRRLSLTPGGTRTLEIEADLDARAGDMSAEGLIDARLELADIALPRASATLDFGGTIVAAGQTREATLQAELALVGETLGATGTAATRGIGSVPFRLDYNVGSTVGSLHAERTFEFFGPAAPLFVPDWDKPFDIDSGKIVTDVRLSWDTPERIAASVALGLDGVAAHYGQYQVGGVAGELRLNTSNLMQPDAWSLAPSRLSLSRIDVGLPLRDVTVGLKLSGHRLTVTEANANLLGGTANAAAFDYDTHAGTAAIDVTLSGIELARVLALEGQDITGTGLLDGLIPVTLTDNQPTVRGGEIAARAPGGTISVSSRLTERAGQAELNFALTALQDFRYSVLNATLDYARNGDLALGVRLQGRNPKIEQGRPIHYNLNISENIPVLLESLRLKDRLNEDIERRFNR